MPVLHKPRLWGVSMATCRENIVTKAFDWIAPYRFPSLTGEDKRVSGIMTDLLRCSL